MSSIKVENISMLATARWFELLFEEYGTVKEVRIPTDRETGLRKGYAIVTFDTAAAAEQALGKNGMKLDGLVITVTPYAP